MSQDVTGIIGWLRSWFDDIYEAKGEISFDDIYPVGSIYLSLSSTFNPNNVFDGEWQLLSNRFLLGSDDGVGVGVMDGSADAVVVEHNHTQKSHNHTQNGHSHGTGNSTNKYFLATNQTNIYISDSKKQITNGSTNYVVYASATGNLGKYNATESKTATNIANTAENNPAGESGIGKNMPPYITVNMWQRIS